MCICVDMILLLERLFFFLSKVDWQTCTQEQRSLLRGSCCLVGHHPESPSVGKPEGCLCNLRSVHIDGHDELKGDGIASHGPYLVCGCSFMVADVTLDTSFLILCVMMGSRNISKSGKEDGIGTVMIKKAIW